MLKSWRPKGILVEARFIKSFLPLPLPQVPGSKHKILPCFLQVACRKLQPILEEHQFLPNFNVLFLALKIWITVSVVVSLLVLLLWIHPWSTNFNLDRETPTRKGFCWMKHELRELFLMKRLLFLRWWIKAKQVRKRVPYILNCVFHWIKMWFQSWRISQGSS